MHASAQASAKVAGAGEDVPQMFVPHEFPAFAFNQFFHFVQSFGEALEDALDVASFLHGDDAGVVFLVDPNKEVLLVIVPEKYENNKIYALL